MDQVKRTCALGGRPFFQGDIWKINSNNEKGNTQK